MPSGPPTKQEIRDVARRAVAIFENHRLSCCLFGSAACELYGRNRVPNDVDIIVMTNDYSPEELKNLLEEGSNQFYTRAARSASATYRVLFYRLPGRRRSCKVDILTPGTNELNIPFIRPRRIVWINELPVLPFLVLLLLKAQGWLDHTMSSRRDFNEKVDVDVRDVNELLGIGRSRGEDINGQTWIPAWFLDHGLSVMQDYVDVNGGHHRWELLGFAPA